MSEKKTMTIYTKEFVAKEVNWLKNDIEEMIEDWNYAMLDIGRDAPVLVPFRSRLEKFIVKLENLQNLIKSIA